MTDTVHFKASNCWTTRQFAIPRSTSTVEELFTALDRLFDPRFSAGGGFTVNFENEGRRSTIRTQSDLDEALLVAKGDAMHPLKLKLK
mmetsp:Transcript_16055/g.43052  ORF Transcript_16055/g.43052 Transcript_16055/m.43052 type:complete len:88 (+) Transcript_16055:182-445(+)|eukprot:CAMPEP_0184721838 /NCGR_PEP_ID=MMETSP0314-20130426/20101_1 /TAXON_ID=38298 /ORGANISM="Rhodella maculata, Strain CCMP 736" /LENGTH=87 /DNA_ID=CAMNT_0027186275 /DNA_START=154 /DNA_END=417 /DNA_ORIENTATION=+